jgi:mannose-1-phosphate guanylyltransferase
VATAAGEALGDNYLSVAGDGGFNGRVVPPARVGRGCRIAGDARVGSLAVLGDNVRVGEGTTIEQAVVLAGAEIGPRCQLRNCILGAGARVGANTHIEAGVVLGEGVTVGSDNILSRGARIFPGVSLPDGAIKF